MRCNRLVLVFVLVLMLTLGGSAVPGFLAAQDEALRVFLDCQTFCDFDHIRREITYVNWVRDRQDAEVHLLVTSQGTGGGGREYALRFIGLRNFQGLDDEIRFATAQTDTQDEIRDAQTQRIALGLGRYVARGALAGRVRVTFTPPAGTPAQPAQQPRDPWDLWVFRISLNGSFRGESQSSRHSISGSLRATRISEQWKFRIETRAFRSSSRFTLNDSTEFKSDDRRYNGNTLLVKSLGRHWSAGVEAIGSRSTQDNYDLRLDALPSIEFNVFPYAESSKRQLVFIYGMGVSHGNYTDTTIFNRLVETRPIHRFTIAAEAVQPWGSLEGQLRLSSYLDDLATNRASIFGNASIRLFRGLNLNFFGSYSRVRDQLSLPKSGATDEEILLQLKQLKTSYFYFGSVGLSYTFGSKFNNVVNPRFNSAESGDCC